MKRLFIVAAFLMSGAAFVSCSSDDSTVSVEVPVTPPTSDTVTPEPEPEPEPEPTSNMVGVWKAETLSYSFTIPGQPEQTHEFPFDHASLKQGCGTDYLTVLQGTTVSLKQNNKNTAGACEDVTLGGTWTESSITISGESEPREVISVNANQLVLKYSMTYSGRTTDVNVTYSKQ